jgi:hypothetical protein
MSRAIQEFVAFWRSFDLDASCPFIHPEDTPWLDAVTAKASGIRIDVPPLPVNGSLERASVIIAMTNAGFGNDGLEWEARNPAQASRRLTAIRNNLYQSHMSQDEYPFYDFDPEMDGHPGSGYWKGTGRKRERKKLRKLSEALAEKLKMPLSEVHRGMANEIAILQRFPYPSPDAKKLGSLPKNLPSAAHAVRLLRGLVEEKQKLIVVIRGATSFGYAPRDSDEKLVVYHPSLAVGAHLSPNSPAWVPLVTHLSARLCK